jgi:hypothetical protein
MADKNSEISGDKFVNSKPRVKSAPSKGAATNKGSYQQSVEPNSKMSEGDADTSKYQQQSESPDAPARGSTFALNDRPRGIDRLGFQDYANAFTALLRNPATKPPLTIGIYAAWGMGKSFLMRMIEDTLKKDPPPDSPEFITVTFNAWGYSGSDNLWAGLVSSIYAAVETRAGKQFTTKFRLRLGENRGKRIGWLSLRAMLLALPVIAISVLLNLGELEKIWISLPGITILGVSSILGLLYGIARTVKSIYDIASKAFIERAEQLKKQAAAPDFKAKIGYMADIKSEIDFVVRLLSEIEPKQPRSIIVFVDDLDRCSPLKAVEVLEAIMLLLSEDESPFYVFLGIDARILVKAIEERYGKVLTDAGVSGYEYLDKIVQIPFTIPAPADNRLNDYLKALLPQPESADGQRSEPPASQPQVETKEIAFTPEEETAFADFHPYITRNPRRAKRIVNTYRLTRLLASPDGEIPSADRSRQLIKWIVMTEQWPYRMGLIIDQRQNAEQLKSGVGFDSNDTLQMLFDEVQVKVDRADSRLRQLDEDNELFLSFLNDESTPITAADIKEFETMTFNLNPAIGGEIRKMLAQMPASTAVQSNADEDDDDGK